jgi:hypothetical protein
MLALDWFRRKRGALLQSPPPPEPEPLYECERPMTGFFASLTPNQLERVLGETDCENLGPEEFRRAG